MTVVLMALSSVPLSAFSKARAMCAKGNHQVAGKDIEAAYNSIQARKPEPR